MPLCPGRRLAVAEVAWRDVELLLHALAVPLESGAVPVDDEVDGHRPQVALGGSPALVVEGEAQDLAAAAVQHPLAGDAAALAAGDGAGVAAGVLERRVDLEVRGPVLDLEALAH